VVVIGVVDGGGLILIIRVLNEGRRWIESRDQVMAFLCTQITPN